MKFYLEDDIIVDLVGHVLIYTNIKEPTNEINTQNG